MSRGYCARCYGLLQSLGWDQEAADAHDLNVKLKALLTEKRKVSR